MKVLFATPHLFPDVVGGSGLHSYHLVKCLAVAGHEVEVLHPYKTRHFTDLPLVKEQTVAFGRTVLEYAGNVDRWIGSRQYDLGYSDGLSLARYVKRKTFPVVVNDHGLLQFQPQYFGDYLRITPLSALKDLLFYWPRIWARTRIARRADYVVSMGGKMNELVEDQLRIPSARILNLPNAVENPAAVPPSSDRGDPQLFLFVGKIEFRKGVSLLLKAFQQLKDSGARLRLVGDGPMVSKVRNSKLPNVELAGQKFGLELQQEYEAAGTFIFPSLQEGMPTVLMEAMGQGRPIIATDVGACRLLVSGETGFLLEPHDTGTIVKAVKRMMALDDGAREAMGQASQKLIQTRFTWERVGPNYIHSLVQAATSSLPANGSDIPVRSGAGF